MSDRLDDLSPDARRARDAVKELSRPRPEASFRSRVKRAFIDGTIAGARVPTAGSAAGPKPARPALARPPAATASQPWWRSRPWMTALVPAAGIAAAAIAVAGLNRGPAWEVVDASGEGIAVVNGRPIPVGHREDLTRAMRGGARVVMTSGASLVIASPGQMVMQITSASDVTLPASVGRWFARAVRAAVRTGEIRVTTGRDFHGARLYVATPEADVRVTGTTLAVIREPRGTCVCVMEGVVDVGAHGQAMAAVTAGHRRYIFNDGRAPEQDVMRPVERVKLGELRDQHQAQMGRSPR
jgi:hypothetical protein